MKDIQTQKLSDSLLKAANNYQALVNMLGRLLEDVEKENQNERYNNFLLLGNTRWDKDVCAYTYAYFYTMYAYIMLSFFVVRFYKKILG